MLTYVAVRTDTGVEVIKGEHSKVWNTKVNKRVCSCYDMIKPKR